MRLNTLMDLMFLLICAAVVTVSVHNLEPELRVHTDVETGCHYLTTSVFSDMTFRVSAEGHHMGCGEVVKSD